MKIIDILNKIENGEEAPKKIKYQYKIFELNDSKVYLRTDKVRDYDYGIKSLLEYVLTCDLNDEVEIIEEEKEIEKIELDSDENIIYYENGEKHRFTTNKQNKYFAKKINKIIDEINRLKKGNDDLSIK